MISVEALKVEFGVKPLFSDASFVVNDRDRIALVGKNGAGKSTLLKILCRQQQPTEGTVSIPNDTTIGYLPQVMRLADDTTVIDEARKAFADTTALKERIDRMNRQLAERTDYESDDYMQLVERFSQEHERYLMMGADNNEAEIERTLTGLGFERTDFERPTKEFSGGWRMRIELAKLLLQRPDVLLLDEPTNHLDIESIQWLEQFLSQSSSAVVLVSHDRAFINNVTTRTIEISCGRVIDYRVKYDEYVNLRRERREQQLRAYENQQKEIADMRAFIERFRYQATKAVQVQQKIKQLEKIVPIEIDEIDNSALRLKFPPCLRSGDYPIICDEVSKSYKAPLHLPPVGGESEVTSIYQQKAINNYQTAHPDSYALIKEYALNNRHNQTDAEAALWQMLKGKSLGAKFRRQHIIGDYIADFACLSHQLVIEVDGGYHNTKDQQEIDKLRTEFLNEVGFRVLRFTNEEVLMSPDVTLQRIKETLAQHQSLPAQEASPTGGGLVGATPVFSNVSFILKRGEKVAFVGKNGEGKTTLVKCIMGEIPFDGQLKIGHNVQIGYFAQNQAQLLDEQLTVFETIDRVARGDIRLRINDILGAFMFGGEASEKKVRVLSGGERSRLAMIKLLLEPVNLLILDEPTNHLDMQSKDVLKEAIRAFDGTAIIVSHDREFLDGLVSKVYEFGGGHVREHLGGIYDFLRKKNIESLNELNTRNTTPQKADPAAENNGDTAAATASAPQRGESYAERKERQRRIGRAEKAVKESEKKIEQMENRLKELDQLLMLPENASDMVLVTEYTTTKQALDEESDRWMAHSEELEQLQQEMGELGVRSSERN
ncbi:MAG: ATP-binding cassette domain-containing protein [Prevotella sp.]|nr:ATP-binding cassette domain-containing protein [Prevotella sp.]